MSMKPTFTLWMVWCRVWILGEVATTGFLSQKAPTVQLLSFREYFQARVDSTTSIEKGAAEPFSRVKLEQAPLKESREDKNKKEEKNLYMTPAKPPLIL